MDLSGMGLRDQFPHTMVPLELAVIIVQQEVYGASETAYGAEPNAIATYIAATVPLYQVASSPMAEPRLLVNVHLEAVFKDGGRELVFLDGRPSKHLLAIQAIEVPCIIAMLKAPQHAQSIRRQAVQERSRQLVKQSRDIRAHHSELAAQLALKLARAKQLCLAHGARLAA